MNRGCFRIYFNILVAEREMWKSGSVDRRQLLTETLNHRGAQGNTEECHRGPSYNASDITGGILAYDDLRDWIKALDRAGELKRMRTEADPILESAEITDRVSKSKDQQGTVGGKALLFENLKGYPGSQLLINQFGSARRMRLALEVDSLDEIAERIRGFMDVKSPQGFLDKVKMLPMLAEMGKFFPKTVATGPCKEVIKRDNFSLLDFPILQCWPKDAGRFITLPCVVTRDPNTGKRNVGMYRRQVFDERTTRMHGKMEVAVALGTDPATTFSAIVPAPPDVEEYLIAGFLRQKPVELVKCETVDLEVPATSEIVLEGHVHLDELRSEGPFGDHTGFYSLEDLYP